MEIEAPLVARKALPGQLLSFVFVKTAKEFPYYSGQRKKGTITIIFQEIGKTTKELGTLEVGEYLSDFVGPLEGRWNRRHHPRLLP